MEKPTKWRGESATGPDFLGAARQHACRGTITQGSRHSVTFSWAGTDAENRADRCVASGESVRAALTRVAKDHANLARQRKYLYADTRKAVADELREELNDQDEGHPHTAGRKKVVEFLEEWLTESVKPSVRPLTFEQYDQHVRLYLAPAFGELQLRKLAQEPGYIQRFITWQLTSGLSPRTVRISLFVLRRALTQAIRRKLIKRNPMEAVDLPRTNRQTVKTFEEDEARRFFDAVHSDPLEAAYLLALLSGLRRGEVLGLRWPDINFEQQTLTVAAPWSGSTRR